MALRVYDQQEEELKKRIMAARAAGWSEDDINAFAQQDLAKIQQRKQMEAQQTQAQQQQGTSGRGGTLTSLISETGGIGGALAGAAAGTAIMPGIGTLLGGLLGGFGGGFLGSAGEQKWRDDKVDWGKAGREGAIEGIFGAGPLRLLKVGGAATKGLVKGGVKKAAQEASEKALAGGVLGRSGRTLVGEARGVGVGEKLAGRRIGPKMTNELNDFVTKRIGVKGGSAAKQLESVEKFIATKSDDLTKAITQSNRALTLAEKNALANKIINKMNKEVIGLTKRQKDIAKDTLIRIRQSNDFVDLDDLRKILDNNINFARNAASPEPAAEQIYKLFRKELTDEVANKVGGTRLLKGELSKALDVQELMLNRAARPGSAISPAGITLPGRAAQSLQTGTGNLLQKLSMPGIRPVGTTARVLTGSAMNNMANLLQGSGQYTGATQPTDLFSADMGTGTSAQDLLGGGATTGQTTSGLQYSSNEFMQAAIKAQMAGDIPAAEQLIQLSDMAATIEQSAGGFKLNNTAIQTLSDMQSGIRDLEDLGQKIAASGGNVPYIGGLLGKIAGSPSQLLQADIDRVKQVVGKALEGGVLRKEDEEKYKKILPTINDSETTAQYKITNILESLKLKVQEWLQNQAMYGGGGSDINDVVNQINQYNTY